MTVTDTSVIPQRQGRGATKAQMQAELNRLREENAALRGLLGAVRDAADAAPQSVYADDQKWHKRQTEMLIRISVLAGAVAAGAADIGVCTDHLAGYAAEPVAYCVYEPETAAADGAR